VESGVLVAGEDPLSSPLLSGIAFFVLVAVTALMVAIEVAYIAVRRSAIVERIKRGDKRAKLAYPHIKEPMDMLAATAIGITLASVVGGATVVATIGALIQKIGVSLGYSSTASLTLGILVGTVIFSYVVLLFGEILPKRLAYQYSEELTLWTAPILRWTIIFTYPLLWLLKAGANLLCRVFRIRLSEEQRYNAAELAIILQMTEDLTKEEKELAERVFRFRETEVRHAMVPRVDWVAIDGDKTIREFIDLALESGKSRLPVYGENQDEIIGVMHIKYAGALERQGLGSQLVKNHASPALFVPESATALSALNQMREASQQMAIVVDEFGGIVGLVTVEDLLEELVGEVFDESDVRQERLKMVSDSSWLAQGGISLKELSFALKTELPHARDYETLSGLIIEKLGKVPAVGARLTVNGLELEVTRATKRRILEVKIERKREIGIDE